MSTDSESNEKLPKSRLKPNSFILLILIGISILDPVIAFLLDIKILDPIFSVILSIIYAIAFIGVLRRRSYGPSIALILSALDIAGLSIYYLQNISLFNGDYYLITIIFDLIVVYLSMTENQILDEVEP